MTAAANFGRFCTRLKNVILKDGERFRSPNSGEFKFGACINFMCIVGTNYANPNKK